MSALPDPIGREVDAGDAAGESASRAAAARVGGRWVTGALALAFAAALGALAWAKHRYYLYDDVDLAILTQSVARLLHGSTFVSIWGTSWLAGHASYAVVLLAPLYVVARTPLTLVLVQAAALAAGAWPVERLAARALGPARDGSPSRARWAFVAAYLLSPAVWFLGLDEFHPEALATTALLFAIDALESDRGVACLAWAGLALLAREDVALVAGMLGAWALVFRRPRAAATGAALIAAAAAVTVVTFVLVRPRFASAAVAYGAMYRWLGASPQAIAASLAGHPLAALARLVSTPGDPADTRLKLDMLAALLGSLAFLPLLAPPALLVALPVLAEHLLSERAQQHTIAYHYTALAIPALAWAAAVGLARVARWSRRAAAAAAVATLGAALVAQLAFGPFGGGAIHSAERALPSPRDVIEAPRRDAMLARLPATGTIVAGFEFLPRLASRADVHSLHHLLGGTYTYSSERYPVPPRVAAVLADWSHPRLRAYAASPEAGRRIGRIIRRDGLSPVAAAGDLVLFERDGHAIPLVVPHPEFAGAPPRASIDGALDYLGDQMAAAPDRASGTVAIVTAWRRVAPIDGVYLERLEIRDAAGRVVATHSRVLGYVVWPVADWGRGVPVVERYDMIPGARLAPGRYAVRMSLARLGSDSPPRVIADASDAFELGTFAVN